MEGTQTVTLSDNDLRAEIEDLQAALLAILLPIVPLLGWAWLYYAIVQEWSPAQSAAPVVLLTVSAYISHRLSARHHIMASCIFVISISLATALIVFAHPYSMAALLGAMTIVISVALLGTLGSLLTTLIAWASVTVALSHATHAPWWVERSVELMAIYALLLGAAWLTMRPIDRATQMALSGWAHAHNALLQMREQRAELYRTLRALEEANYRIERANQALSVAQREAEASRELKARFATTVSHELRGPLNLILGFSRLMCLSPESYPAPLPSAYRSDIYTIYRGSQHLLSLVDDILDLSQIEAQRLPLVKDRVELETDVIERVIDVVRPLAERKGLSIIHASSEPLPWILADAVRLRQAMLNILTNAIRFTERGSITVESQPHEDTVVVSISDTGPGIAADDIPKLFREFSQIHAQDMGEDAGSGLGLAITKELVELHGGSIWVDSVLGEGTTFCFSLPVPRSQPVTPRMVKTSATGRRSMIPTCIIVHDDPDIIRLFGRYLTGYRVAGLPSEVDLARLANQLRPSAIITNSTRIPAVSARIDELPFDIPLIGCQIPHLYETHHSGSILGYLVKPVAPELLTAILGRLDHHNDTTVLIVDDDADAVRLLERMLTALPNPYRISKAYDGNQALELMRESPPRILMLDFVMPNLSGEEVLRQMQADESLRDIPVVIISGQDWINPGLTLGNAIHMECREPLSLTGGLECMQAILNTLGPNALHAPAAFQPSQEGAPEEQAFAVQHQLPEPEPGEVDPGPNRSQ